jgi:hypothetical protein
MKTPPKRASAPPDAPDPQSLQLAQLKSAVAIVQVCDDSPLVCSAQKSRSREDRALLRFIANKLTEIEATIHSPLVVRQLHLRYCCCCGERVTNANVGGYTGKSTLTGRLYCTLCAEAMKLKLDADNPADREKLRRAILDLVAERKMRKR